METIWSQYRHAKKCDLALAGRKLEYRQKIFLHGVTQPGIPGLLPHHAITQQFFLTAALYPNSI